MWIHVCVCAFEKGKQTNKQTNKMNKINNIVNNSLQAILGDLVDAAEQHQKNAALDFIVACKEGDGEKKRESE